MENSFGFCFAILILLGAAETCWGLLGAAAGLLPAAGGC